MSRPIGFIGLGIMGKPMALNLLAKGFSLAVYNRTAEKAREFEEKGAKVASTPREVAATAETVILMLSDPSAIDAVVEGADGLFASMAQGSILVNMSSVSPAYSRDLAGRAAKRGITLVDAPVSGSKKPAEDGTLVILASGPEEAVTSLEPVFLAMGKKVVYCGEAGMGSAMKMAVNLLLGVMMAGLAEATNFAERQGIETIRFLDTILAGPLSCGLFQLKAEMFKEDLYPTQFPLKHMFKDLRFIMETAESVGAPLSTGGAVKTLYEKATEQGLGEEDFAAVKKLLARVGGGN